MPNSTNKLSPARIPAPSLEDLAIRSGISSEHVLLEGDEAYESVVERPRAIKRRFAFRNRIRDAETAFVLFDSGYLGITERRNGKPQPERTIDLRYLDPRPLVSRRVARTARLIAVGSIGVAVVAGLLIYLSALPGIAAAVMLGAVAAGSAALWAFLRGTEEEAAFRTQHGRAIVLTMIANYGSFRACRGHARSLVAAINEARRQAPTAREHMLRAEIREHYRLAEAGILSTEACTAAVRRALAQFDR